MIKNAEPLSMADSLEYLRDESSGTDVKGFVKKFVKTSVKDSKEMKKKLEELNLIKLKKEDIIKIIDLMPEDKEDLNKIFTDMGLDEDETKKILDTIKKYK